MQALATPSQATHAPADAGPVLKLYIDSTSLALVHQAADLAACADEPGVFKIIAWLRLPLAPAQLEGCNASYVRQLAALSPDFVAEVVALVQRHRFSRIEIHGNQYHAWRGVLPLVRALVPCLPDPREVLRLSLYDDGTVGLVQREALKADPDPAARLAQAGAQLRRAVLDRQPLQWDIAHGYAWQHLFDTRYHLLRSDLLLRDAPGRALHALVAPTEMRFDGLPQLSDAQTRRYLQLFGLDAAVAERLAPVAGRQDALLFTGSATWDREQNRRLADNQRQAIEVLHANGCLPPELRLAYKGHPANGEHDAMLMAALGPEVIALPQRVPMEVLMMAGLLPARVAGVMSSSYCSLPNGAIAYLLCRRCAVEGGPGSALVALMLEAGLIDEARLLPLLD